MILGFILHPWHILVLALASLIRREQEKAIEYPRTENQVLREKLGEGRVLLNDGQRRRLAVPGKALGRKALSEVATIAAPDTILRWHRQLLVQKRDCSDGWKPVGRPRTRQEAVNLILRMAKENEDWGYDRIKGALQNLGYQISDTTVGKILKEHGIPPAPERSMTWEKFIKSQWEVMGASAWAHNEARKCSGLASSCVPAQTRLFTRRA